MAKFRHTLTDIKIKKRRARRAVEGNRFRRRRRADMDGAGAADEGPHRPQGAAVGQGGRDLREWK